jgi:flagellar motor protein MotB
MKKPNQTLSAIGNAIGTKDRIDYESMQVHREAYAVAEADAKKAMMSEFIIGYIMGNAEVSEDVATAIYAKARPTPAKPKGKDVRTADEQACYKRGYAKWNYHVIDAAPKLPKKAKPAQEVSYRFTPEAKAKATAFLALVKGDFAKAVALLESVAE